MRGERVMSFCMKLLEHPDKDIAILAWQYRYKINQAHNAYLDYIRIFRRQLLPWAGGTATSWSEAARIGMEDALQVRSIKYDYLNLESAADWILHRLYHFESFKNTPIDKGPSPSSPMLGNNCLCYFCCDRPRGKSDFEVVVL